jgi:hypothetical protein
MEPRLVVVTTSLAGALAARATSFLAKMTDGGSVETASMDDNVVVWMVSDLVVAITSSGSALTGSLTCSWGSGPGCGSTWGLMDDMGVWIDSGLVVVITLSGSALTVPRTFFSLADATLAYVLTYEDGCG